MLPYLVEIEMFSSPDVSTAKESVVVVVKDLKSPLSSTRRGTLWIISDFRYCKEYVGHLTLSEEIQKM